MEGEREKDGDGKCGRRRMGCTAEGSKQLYPHQRSGPRLHPPRARPRAPQAAATGKGQAQLCWRPPPRAVTPTHHTITPTPCPTTLLPPHYTTLLLPPAPCPTTLLLPPYTPPPSLHPLPLPTPPHPLYPHPTHYPPNTLTLSASDRTPPERCASTHTSSRRSPSHRGTRARSTWSPPAAPPPPARCPPPSPSPPP